MKPPLYYVRDKGSRVAHHWDYEGDRNDRALCGQDYVGEIVFEGFNRPARVCRACQDLAPHFEAKWWRQKAIDAANKRDEVQRQKDLLTRDINRMRGHIAKLNRRIGAEHGKVASLRHKLDDQARKIANQKAEISRLHTALENAKRGTRPAPAK